MKFKRFITTAATAGAVLVAGSLGALAVEAQATTNVNVRTGPGTNFGVLDALNRGERVNILECTNSSNWCYVDQDGPNGWVSARYLEAVPPPPPPPGSGSGGARECELRLTLGSGRPTMELVCTDPTPPPPPPPPPPPARGDEACFYRDANFQGPSFCEGIGRLNSLDPRFDNRISSVKLYGDAIVKMCVDTNMSGYCTRIVNDAPVLGPLLDDRASSLRVFLPGVPGTPSPSPRPTTYQTGPLTLDPGQHADLDDGTIGTAGTDIWYRAPSGSAPARLVPIRGALIALGDGTNRGYAGCSAADFKADPIPLWQMPPGTYACVKTNQDRIAQIRMGNVTGDTIRFGFTTWAD